MIEVFKNNNFRFLSFFFILNLIMLYGCSLYLNYISISNFHGIYIFSFIFFSVALFNISFGFTTIVIGFFSKFFDKQAKSNIEIHKSITSKTSILFPIYNEDTSSVYSRIKVLYIYLKLHKLLDNIDIYILSDSNNLNIILKEELAFRELETEFGLSTNLNYRRRINNINHKSGNIADFCKRYGNNYDFMIIMDADSYMSVSTIKKIIIEMESNSNLGLLQTYPQVIFPRSIYQIFSYIHSIFSAELYVRGSEFWNGGQGPYWGHNSILNINAFMNFCLLPKLPKIGPLGEKILSHDTIEASLLRQAGYTTKFMFFENSSFEETPPTLLDAFKRDYRWCQGNLQHFWFIFVNQFGTKNRIYILLGIISYLAYLFWFLFLLSTLAIYILDNDMQFNYINGYVDNGLLELTIFVIVILFLPRLLSLLNYILYSNKVNYNIIIYYISDTIIVIFSSSIHLILITYFVISSLIGKKIQWKNQSRKINISKNKIDLYFYTLTIIGFILSIFLYKLSISILFYFSPIIIGLIFSIPISYLYDFVPNTKINLNEPEQKEVRLLSYFLKRKYFSYTEIDNTDPLYMILMDPRLFFIHSSFLKKKKINKDRSQKIVNQFLKDPTSETNHKIRYRIFNHRSALDLLKEKYFELDDNQKWKDANKNFKKYYINN